MRFRFGTDDDVEALSDLVGRCFDDGPGVDLAALQRLAYRALDAMDPATCWLAETEDGTVVARWQLLRQTIAIRGVAVPAAGALGVAIHPDHRSPGLLAEFLTSGREAVRSLGMPVHIGFVEQGSLWSHFGGEPIQPRYHARFDPDCISDRETLELRALPAASEALLMEQAAVGEVVDRHNRLAIHRTGALLRDPIGWPFQRHRPRELFVGEGVHLGYSRGESLHVHEAEADGFEGHLALLATAASHARAHGLPLTADLPPDHGFLAAARPRGLTVEITYPQRSQGIGALEDPQDLLDRLASALPEGSLTWVVEDRDQTWILDRGGPEVRTQTTSGALLQILLGYAPASVQRSARRLRCDPDAASSIDRFFPPLHPFTCLSDRF